MTDSRPDSWSIIVVRTGGFAGLRREWQVKTSDAPDVDWATLIDACPWSAAAKPVDSRARDQFAWRVEVSTPGRSCTATLNDAQVTGPWRALVDRVRELPR